ncbi:MAG TPA: hypothetical protein VK588_16410 [Chitinophagaceae bacterium]|nr:hypothetical protein [Chitinophagaceae bacterium]
MKNTLITVVYVVLAMTLIFVSFLFLACKKQQVSNHTPKDTQQSNSCNASKAAVENIEMFPSDNAWNKDISNDQLDANSNQIIATFSSSVVKTDFGSGTWEGSPIGIPYVVVCGSQEKIAVNFTDYGDESDPGPYPIPLDAPIEGMGTGDAHVISVDMEHGMLYELFNAHVNGNHWDASSGAIFNLNSNQLRPDTWTSADAAGLPIFEGLVRYDEVAKGVIDHAIRFTLTSSNVKPSYILPARHKVNSSGGQYSLPFGARIRLKSNFDISSFSSTNQIILKAMKKYGLMLADIGSNMYISGAPDDRWNNDELRQLLQVHASDFEVVKPTN